jgi:hypothetical protein
MDVKCLLHAYTALPPGKDPRYRLDRRLAGLKDWYLDLIFQIAPQDEIQVIQKVILQEMVVSAVIKVTLKMENILWDSQVELYYDGRSVGQSVVMSGTHLGPATNFFPFFL